jgi:hypothetical protein
VTTNASFLIVALTPLATHLDVPQGRLGGKLPLPLLVGSGSGSGLLAPLLLLLHGFLAGLAGLVLSVAGIVLGPNVEQKSSSQGLELSAKSGNLQIIHFY